MIQAQQQARLAPPAMRNHGARHGQVRIYIVLLLASLAYNYSFVLIDFLRPFLVRDLHMTLANTALLYSAQGAGVILGSLAVPVFASRWGCRRILAVATWPIRLRPMGSSLFHGGHIISLFAPLLVVTVARSYPLVFGMALAPLTFLVAALLWWSLPETLRTGVLYRGFSAETPEASLKPKPV